MHIESYIVLMIKIIYQQHKFQQNLEFPLDKENLGCYHRSTTKLGKDKCYGQEQDFSSCPHRKAPG